ncbi:sensor histidine kinase, partial [Streptomyces sp. SID7803]|nr:sensor histidine kinase [Streptomyces sp. SID7803]
MWVLHGWEALSWGGIVTLVTLVTMAGGSPGDRKLGILAVTVL